MFFDDDGNVNVLGLTVYVLLLILLVVGFGITFTNVFVNNVDLSNIVLEYDIPTVHDGYDNPSLGSNKMNGDAANAISTHYRHYYSVDMKLLLLITKHFPTL